MTDRQINGLRSLHNWLQKLAYRINLLENDRLLAQEYAEIVQKIADEHEADAVPDPVTLDELFGKNK